MSAFNHHVVGSAGRRPLASNRLVGSQNGCLLSREIARESPQGNVYPGVPAVSPLTLVRLIGRIADGNVEWVPRVVQGRCAMEVKPPKWVPQVERCPERRVGCVGAPRYEGPERWLLGRVMGAGVLPTLPEYGRESRAAAKPSHGQPTLPSCKLVPQSVRTASHSSQPHRQ